MSDETWDQKITRLRKQKPTETYLTMPDPDAVAAVREAMVAVQAARVEARKAGTAADVDYADLDEWVEKQKPVKDALKALNRAQDAAADAEVTFTFRKLPPDVYDELPAKYPPTDEQRERDLMFNPKTYLPALAAACSSDGITEEQWTSLLTVTDDDKEDEQTPFNQGDRFALMEQLRELNQKPSLMLGKGSRSTRN